MLNNSSAKQLRFSKTLAALLSLQLLMPLAATASESAAPDDDEISISELAKQGLQLMQNATSSLTDDDEEIIESSINIQNNAANLFPEAEGIAEEVPEATERGHEELPAVIRKAAAPDWLKKQMEEAEAIRNEPILFLFATRAMPELEFQEMLRESAGRHLDNRRVVVVLKGIFEDETMPDALKDIHAAIKKADLDYEPNIIINPLLFKKFGVRDVPEIVYAREDNDLIRATGTFAVNWLMNEYENKGRTGDIGNYGGTYVVAETDMIELMQERASKLDLAAKRQEIIDNYWKNKTFVEIPPATQDLRFQYDPTIVVSQDVLSPDGTVVARQGDRINPLFDTPFDMKIVIFDSMDEEQVIWVQDKVAELEKENTRFQLISTGLDSTRGWDHLKELDKRYGSPVYLLTPEIQGRFNINQLPAIIEADDRYFYVNQYAVSTPKPVEAPEANPGADEDGADVQTEDPGKAMTVKEMEALRKQQEQEELREMFKRGE